MVRLIIIVTTIIVIIMTIKIVTIIMTTMITEIIVIEFRKIEQFKIKMMHNIVFKQHQSLRTSDQINKNTEFCDKL